MTRLIDIDELADYLKLKKQTIYNWLHQRKISGIKVGGVWRFDRRDIDSWLKSRRRLSKTSGESQ
jgi:excisionase family DNA binding protein